MSENGEAEDQEERRARRNIIRNAVGIGIATGAYGISFGALSTAGGLSVVQTSFLSLLMFTGASQFALVGVIAGRGGAAAAAGTAILLGARNAMYGLRLSSLLRLQGVRRFMTAQFVIDETTAMAIRGDTVEASRLGFLATAIAVYGFWNLGTIVGSVGAHFLSNPKNLGLDAAAPAAFLALLAPRIRSRESWAIALGGIAAAMISTSFVPAGVQVLLAGITAAVIGLAFLNRQDATAGPAHSVTS